MKKRNKNRKRVLIYDQFIEYLKNEERKGFQSQESLDLEKHHILPLHAGGEKNGPVVLCSSRNHKLAHYYRYLTYRQLGDKVCFQMRRGCKMSSSEKALLAIQKMKREKIGFFNSKWQSVQGKKTKKNQKRKNNLTNVTN